MSPKQVKITPGLVGDRDAVVDAAHRDHAHRAARPVHELDVGRQQVVDAVLVDRVRVPAADLHDLVVAAGLDGGEDLAGQRPGRGRRRGTRRRTSQRHQGDTGVDEDFVTRPGLDERDLDGVVGAVASSQSASASSRTRRTRIGVPSSEQVMQCSESQLIRSRSRAARSSSCSYSAPIATSSSCVARASSSSITEIAKPTWIRTQSPGPMSSRRPMLTVRRTPATSTRASWLDSSTTSTI